SRGVYFAVIAGISWVAWSAAGVFGATVGAVAPAAWQLDFVVPLIFTALLAGAGRSRAALGAAAIGGCVAVAAGGLPLNLGLIVGALAGIAAGGLVESASSSGPRADERGADPTGTGAEPTPPARPAEAVRTA